ncbi:alpha/beta fold hydrolase [Acetobacter okinawensis]|uniref:alpha/beta hydrolase n=1 Tax=Acetobacter okinawensis TaxID=1076594 RepID=UPI001BA591F6|nr:alpha/beta fold hydrolase [Acetobacter okinawensis]
MPLRSSLPVTALCLCLAWGQAATAPAVRAQAPTFCAGKNTAPEEILKDKNFSEFTYGFKNNHALRIYVRKATAKRNVLAIFIHGGGWLYGSADQFHDQMTYLGAYGISSIAIDYSTFCANNGDPAMATADVNTAVAFIMQHAVQILGFDPRRVFVVGGSSGGQLALSLLVANPWRSRVDGLVLYNPVIDVDIPLTRLYFPQLSPSLRSDLSPRQHLAAMHTPMLILHGKEDALIPITDIRQFCHVLLTSCRLEEFSNAGHGFFNKNPYKADTQAAMRAFMEQQIAHAPE